MFIYLDTHVVMMQKFYRHWSKQQVRKWLEQNFPQLGEEALDDIGGMNGK